MPEYVDPWSAQPESNDDNAPRFTWSEDGHTVVVEFNSMTETYHLPEQNDEFRTRLEALGLTKPQQPGDLTYGAFTGAPTSPHKSSPEPVLSGAAYEEAPWALADEPEPVPVVEFDTQPEQDTKRDVVALIADDSGQAVALFRDPDEVQRMARSLSGALVEQVRQVWVEARTPRIAKHGPEHKPSEIEVAEELRTLADARDTLTAIASAISTGADEARAIAGEVLAEVAPDERKAKTVRVADGHGWDLKVVRSQPTEATAHLDEIQDALAGWGLAQHTKDKGEHFTLGFARGQRYAMEALLSVLASPKVKTTALDALVKTLEGAGEEDLALRLRHAYGRKSKGEPRIDLSREAPKDGGASHG